MSRCDRTCACHGLELASRCPYLPGCDPCRRAQGYFDVPGGGFGHVVASIGDGDSEHGLVLIHLHGGESLHDVVRREVEEDDRPRWMN